jgi:hypothetical protein
MPHDRCKRRKRLSLKVVCVSLGHDFFFERTVFAVNLSISLFTHICELLGKKYDFAAIIYRIHKL